MDGVPWRKWKGWIHDEQWKHEWPERRERKKKRKNTKKAKWKEMKKTDYCHGESPP